MIAINGLSAMIFLPFSLLLRSGRATAAPPPLPLFGSALQHRFDLGGDVVHRLFGRAVIAGEILTETDRDRVVGELRPFRQVRLRPHIFVDGLAHDRQMAGRAGADAGIGLDAGIVIDRCAGRPGAAAERGDEGLRIGAGRPLHEQPRRIRAFRIARDGKRGPALVADAWDFAVTAFRRLAQRNRLRRNDRFAKSGNLGLRRIVEIGEELAPGEHGCGDTLRDRLTLTIPGPLIDARRHDLAQRRIIIERGDAPLVIAGEFLVSGKDRAAVAPQHRGPFAFQRIMARFHLAGITINLRSHLLGNSDGIVEEILEGRRGLEAELLVDILAVDHDEDRDIVGHADPAILVFGDTVNQRRHEVVDIVVRHGEVGLCLNLLTRVENILAERGRPALVDVIKVVGAERGGDVECQLLQNLFERQNFDFHLDAGRLFEIFLELRVDGVGWRRRFRRKLQRRPGERFADVLQPGKDVLAGGQLLLSQRPVHDERAAAHAHAERGGSKAELASRTQKRTAIHSPTNEPVGDGCEIKLSIFLFHGLSSSFPSPCLTTGFPY
ncbi:hypothetical protein AT6N2_C2979 [Agrobacterium tumefaciens]|nr:hypothetical protein AT6N2_C2979 [Agrobacterium tumefaciens]